jgi:photosystem II stability/assembly factor-like uncharacterized protein
VIYAGTWHLPWKTKDGGRTWQRASRGMDYDSDIFSILVDSTRPHVVLASACSGIYRSNSRGKSFRKVQDIPDSARRTHVLRQNPKSPRIIFAGTTEGLWKTVDGGISWKRATRRSIVVNDVAIDPWRSNRVLLATDRLGVLMSEDGGRTFASSNHGFAHRYVTSMVADKQNPDAFYVGVANDREWGGVFSFNQEYDLWEQISNGLGGRDVLSLKQTSNGVLVAGTSRGVFVLGSNPRKWSPAESAKGNPLQPGWNDRKRDAETLSESTISNAQVNDLDLRDGLWLAATSVGLLKSLDDGKSWRRDPILGVQDFIAIQSKNNLLVAATSAAIAVSVDGGTVWHLSTPPKAVRGAVLSGTGQIMISTWEGGFCSPDAGETWHAMLNGLPGTGVSTIVFDERNARLLAVAEGSIFESEDDGRSWRRGPDAGVTIRSVSTAYGRILAATSDGIVIQPRIKSTE